MPCDVDKVKKTMPNCQVIITDHHLAPSVLPNADAIVNPNQPGCGFPSKNLAGVGVAFYVLVAVRRLLIDSGWFDDLGIKPTQMSKYLDLVALGTISDIVPLDRNNRILVDNGLSIIRKRKSCSGINALLALGRRDQSQIIASDLSYNLAPKINAAGRLDDMDWGVKCLLTDDPVQADLVSEKLNALNHERREIEKDMQESVEVDLINYDDGNVPHTICLYDETWHQGLLGILAARIKEKHHRPCIVFAKSSDGELKGSARSISKLHMRDTLHEINMLHPGIVKRFGGHAMAAGLSISESDFETFSKAFNAVVTKKVEKDDLERVIITDGYLDHADINLETAFQIQKHGPWGHGFPEPLFQSSFEVLEQRIVGSNHLKLVLSIGGEEKVNAIYFNCDEFWPN